MPPNIFHGLTITRIYIAENPFSCDCCFFERAEIQEQVEDYNKIECSDGELLHLKCSSLFSSLIRGFLKMYQFLGLNGKKDRK